MTTARERLLDAALAALTERSWAQVQMTTDVAKGAGLSRQTLYNEFGSKDGLARALAWREIDRYLAGVGRALAGPPHARPVDRLVAVADWTMRILCGNPVMRTSLTGSWDERLMRPPRAAAGARGGPDVPGRHRADGLLPSPTELVDLVKRLAADALAPDRPPEQRQGAAAACEIAVRLALSQVTVPAGAQEIRELVRRALHPMTCLETTRPPGSSLSGRDRSR